MQVRTSQALMFLLFATLCTGGMWWQEKQLYDVANTPSFSTCTDNVENEDQRHPDCIVEDIDHLPFSALSSALTRMAPPEFLQGGFSADRISLSLFPHVEYAVVRRCVFSSIQHPYCEQDRREEVHRFVQQQLALMLQSTNEDIQYRAMLLACARNRVGRAVSNTGDTEKQQGISLYISLCEDDPKKKEDKIRESLQQKHRSESILLLSLLEESKMDSTSFSKDFQLQSPLSTSLYNAVYSTAQE